MMLSDKFLGNFFTSYYVNIDAGTRDYHTEMDATYTLITVPRQVDDIHNVYFSFKLEEKNEIKIKMRSGVTFMYSAYFLLHRQECSTKNRFINLSAYTNRRLVQNLNKSVGRK